MPYSLAELNQMSQAEFVAALGSVFEDTPTIAHQAWPGRPFPTLEDLHQSMMTIVHQLNADQKLALIQAHPDLGSKAEMAPASVQEQANLGLDRLTPDEFDRLHQLNQAYRQRFGFPFILAIKNHTKASILDALDLRLKNSASVEQQQALSEIAQIAWFRLSSLVA